MTSGTKEAAAPVKTGMLLVLVALLPPVAVALPVMPLGFMDEAVMVMLLAALDERRAPLQRPVVEPGVMLHLLKAHCESEEHAELKLPQRVIRPELLA